MQHTEKSFNGNLQTIRKSGEKLAQAIHDAGMFAIAQANEHGNTGFATRLIEAMGKKLDVQRVVNWLVAFGKIGVSKGVIVFRKRKDILPENLDKWLAKAEANPYWEYTKQKKLVENVDYLALVAGIIAKHSRIEKGETNGKEYTEDNVGVVAELIKVYDKLAKKAPAIIKPVTIAPVAS
jgi:hypothetical protein